MKSTCCAVTSDQCAAPANAEAAALPSRLPECFGCGEKVCHACSSQRAIPGIKGRHRLCDNCLAQQPDGEAAVLLRRYHQAGYPEITIQRCREILAAQAAYITRHEPTPTGAPQ